MIEKKKIYDKLNIVYLIILMLYPLLRAGQGLSIMDTTYSVSNYAFFDRMNGTWIIATYLSNVVGNLIFGLPYGNTLFGMNIYTSLIAGITAVISYSVLKRDINQHIVFLGEILALSFCWCPTTILYNYLSYFLFTVGTLLVYRSLAGAKDDRYIAAGIVLGINVAARFPNVTEAALILAIWYVGIIEHKKILRVLKESLLCIAGYLMGAGFFILVIRLKYGAGSFTGMIKTLFAMTDKATDYKPTSMITAMFSDYEYAGKWIALFMITVVAGTLLIKVLDKGFKLSKAKLFAAVFITLATFLVIRICYGQGMFTLRYYEYRSMYYWAVILLAFTSIICIAHLCASGKYVTDDAAQAFVSVEKNDNSVETIVHTNRLSFHHKRILSAIVLLEIYITCLGSNNGLYPIVNNMFIAAPFLLWIVYDWLKEKNKNFSRLTKCFTFSISIVLLIVCCCSLIQGLGFHTRFALQDGDDGVPRKSQISEYEVTKHIYTTEENAKNLGGLMDFIGSSGNDAGEVILYGNVPGLGFLLNKPSALSTFWPDLDSYTYTEWENDLKDVDAKVAGGYQAPFIITSIQVAAWEGGDEKAIDYFGIDKEKYKEDKKLNDLVDFIHKNGYSQVYCNDAFSVYYIE